MEGIIILVIAIVGWGYWRKRKKEKSLKVEFKQEWSSVLNEYIPFYRQLDVVEKKRFEACIAAFLSDCRITGIKTSVIDRDRLLIASSSVIPVFYFPEWKYIDVEEVLVYPDAFDHKFTVGSDKPILGMVGNGYMEGMMILSKKSLYRGFQNETDKFNTAIHEFVHLLDKKDGEIDGIPKVLMDRQYLMPWIDLVEKKMKEIHRDDSDIRKYGGTNREEFFAVLCEYFFERPALLHRKHPELYEMLQQMFNKDWRKQHSFGNRKKSPLTERNALCPCNSGKKFKNCCLKN